MKYVLKHAPGLLGKRDSSGMNAMAYACQLGCKESIKVLLAAGAKIGTGCGPSRMSPLHYAASYGRFELCEWLIEQKARVLSKDKFARTPLSMAVRNGHLKTASLLMQHGSDIEQADSSGNAPLHYAAAYGWMDCVDFLVKSGANVNV